MRDIILNSDYWGVALNCVAFLVGSWLLKKFRSPIFNPILIGALIAAAFIWLLDIPYEKYAQSSNYITYLLAPATVALALPLYEQIELVKKHCAAIFISVTAGVIAGMVGVLCIAALFGLQHWQYVTMLPKSITTPIGISLSEELGGVREITVVVIVMTGIFGNITAEWVCKTFKITNPISRGLAIGNCSHVIGTSKAFEMGKIEGAMGGIAILIAGIITVFAAMLMSGFY